MPDAMTRLLANVGLSDLERRLRDEAIDDAQLRNMSRLLVRSTAPPVTPGDGDSAY